MSSFLVLLMLTWSEEQMEASWSAAFTVAASRMSNAAWQDERRMHAVKSLPGCRHAISEAAPRQMLTILANVRAPAIPLSLQRHSHYLRWQPWCTATLAQSITQANEPQENELAYNRLASDLMACWRWLLCTSAAMALALSFVSSSKPDPSLLIRYSCDLGFCLPVRHTYGWAAVLDVCHLQMHPLAETHLKMSL